MPQHIKVRYLWMFSFAAKSAVIPAPVMSEWDCLTVRGCRYSDSAFVNVR